MNEDTCTALAIILAIVGLAIGTYGLNVIIPGVMGFYHDISVMGNPYSGNTTIKGISPYQPFGIGPFLSENDQTLQFYPYQATVMRDDGVTAQALVSRRLASNLTVTGPGPGALVYMEEINGNRNTAHLVFSGDTVWLICCDSGTNWKWIR